MLVVQVVEGISTGLARVTTKSRDVRSEHTSLSDHTVQHHVTNDRRLTQTHHHRRRYRQQFQFRSRRPEAEVIARLGDVTGADHGRFAGVDGAR